MSEDSSEEKNYADDGLIYHEEGGGYEGIATRAKYYLNLDPHYLPHWGIKEGFRETIQNWKDEILKVTRMREQNFMVIKTNTKKGGFWLAYDRTDKIKTLRGFIHFKPRVDNPGVGTVYICNFDAMFRKDNLKFGNTSKANDNTLLGQHGEGAKTAAQTFRKSPFNHSFSIITCSVRIPFQWDHKKELVAWIHRIPEKDLHDAKARARLADSEGKPRGPEYRPWQDVTVVIGESVTCFAQTGETVSTRPVDLAEFEECLEQSLDINPPSDVVSTDSGDLIRDPKYNNQIFLHSMKLPHGSKSEKPFHYCYNLRGAKTGRDRGTLANANEEAKMIAAIWAAALLEENKSGKNELLKRYVELLRGHFDTAADAGSVWKHMNTAVVSLVWSFMRKVEEGSDTFYYCPYYDSGASEVITQQLGKKAQPLERGLWDVLKNVHLCRSPREECRRRFGKAERVEFGDTDFAQQVVKGVNALFTLNPSLSDKIVVPVSARNLGIKIDYQDGRFIINDRLLTYEGSHEGTFCEAKEDGIVTADGPFFCDHAVIRILDEIIRIGFFNNLDTSGIDYLRRIAETKLRQIPRAIKVLTSADKSQLIVSWTSRESLLSSQKAMRVVCHAANCTGRSMRVHRPTSTDFQCPCPFTTCTVGSGRAIITDIDLNTKYFPVVSRDEDGAFCGSVDKPVCANDLEIYQEPPPVLQGPRYEDVLAVFSQPHPEGWNPISYEGLYKGLFPHDHVWVESQEKDQRALMAVLKPPTALAEVKRVLEDSASDRITKKVRH
ncbi:hypothetical protein BDV96DRAFT_655554 [Lophiotrema nucula]|uniref:Uncharacterized protein n=1 Tax=Lophiotrema nucula TaxID=690887 RepID=A0A6A5YE30_9PLEO|nr:hypothetical protein BDV96DRAFT_655554 [Lophiotrema nucula]